MINFLATASIIVVLTLLPGAWIAYALPLRSLRWYARLALAITFTPVVITSQVLILKAIQVPFSLIPTLLLLVNLPALLLLVRAFWQPTTPFALAPANAARRATMVGIGGGVSLVALLFAYLALPWRLVNGIRPFAWHALWHTDITYALTRNALLPEEPELAGMHLSYGWFGHLLWSVVGWATNLPPTLLYTITNMIWLLAAVALAYALCRQGLQLSRPTALLGTGTIFVGTNALGVVAWLYARDWHWQSYYLGDLRYTPMLGKYIGFETMPFAFALLLALLLVSVLALRVTIPRLALILTLLLSGLGLIYPILFPAGCLVVGLLWLLLATGWSAHGQADGPHYSARTLIWLIIGGAISLVITFGFLQIVTIDGNNAPIHVSAMAAMKPKSLQAMTALLLFVPGLVYVASVKRRQRAPVLLMVASMVAMMALYVVADLEALEYKYILAATMAAAPLGAAGVGQLLTALPLPKRITTPMQWGVASIILLGLVGANQLLMLRVGAQVPTNLGNAPAIDEAAFWLQLQPQQQEAPWVAAIRDQTPANTIVVTTESRIHLSPFLGRSLYAPSDVDGTAIAGYSVDNRYNLLSWRGYAPALLEERLQTVQALYGKASFDRGDTATALMQILALGRPLAVHLSTDSALHHWLVAQQIGEELAIDRVADTGGDEMGVAETVWYIEPTATTLQRLESVDEYAAQ